MIQDQVDRQVNLVQAELREYVGIRVQQAQLVSLEILELEVIQA